MEFTNYYTPLSWLTFDAVVSVSDSRFSDHDTSGPHIPGSISTVVAAGVTVDDIHGFFGGLRLRFFGPRSLIEDDSQRSAATVLLNADIGYKLDHHWQLAAGIFNLLDSRDHDIDYYYASRISASEPVDGVNDIHFHPVEPRQVRFTLTGRF